MKKLWNAWQLLLLARHLEDLHVFHTNAIFGGIFVDNESLMYSFN